MDFVYFEFSLIDTHNVNESLQIIMVIKLNVTIQYIIKFMVINVNVCLGL